MHASSKEKGLHRDIEELFRSEVFVLKAGQNIRSRGSWWWYAHVATIPHPFSDMVNGSIIPWDCCGAPVAQKVTALLHYGARRLWAEQNAPLAVSVITGGEHFAAMNHPWVSCKEGLIYDLRNIVQSAASLRRYHHTSLIVEPSNGSSPTPALQGWPGRSLTSCR